MAEAVVTWSGSSLADVLMASATFDDLQRYVSPQFASLASHSLYRRLDGLEALRVFMEHHVFAVWDFMCLLKALQRHFTCTDTIWLPTGHGSTRRLINALVLEEESDEIDGVPTSHFEVYLRAMREVGADLGRITRFLQHLSEGLSLETSLHVAEVPTPAAAFVGATFALIGTNRPAVICAAFTLGREQAIPDIFGALLESIPGGCARLPALERYLRRHIELDGEDHGPKARAMLSTICGDDSSRWSDAAAARYALEARIALWSGIENAIIAAQASISRRSHASFRAGTALRPAAMSLTRAALSGRDDCRTKDRVRA